MQQDIGRSMTCTDIVKEPPRYLMKGRFFGPATARFLSSDPLPEGAQLNNPQSWNRYAYVLNRPLNYTDPSGQEWYDIGGSWTYFENTPSLEFETMTDGTSSLMTVIGIRQIITFNGSRLDLYNSDGSRHSWRAVAVPLTGGTRSQHK